MQTFAVGGAGGCHESKVANNTQRASCCVRQRCVRDIGCKTQKSAAAQPAISAPATTYHAQVEEMSFDDVFSITQLRRVCSVCKNGEYQFPAAGAAAAATAVTTAATVWSAIMLMNTDNIIRSTRNMREGGRFLTSSQLSWDGTRPPTIDPRAANACRSGFLGSTSTWGNKSAESVSLRKGCSTYGTQLECATEID